MALLETLAHTPAKMLNSNNYQLITLSVPDNFLAEKILLFSLPEGWDAADMPIFTKRLGDKFLNDKISLMLTVPCVLMSEEINYVVNPLHKDFRKVKILRRRRICFAKRIAVNTR